MSGRVRGTGGLQPPPANTAGDAALEQERRGPALTDGERIRELASLAAETAASTRTLLAMFRGLSAGTDSARARLVMSGRRPAGTDDPGLTVYEGTTCEGSLAAAARHLEYAERILGGHARALAGRPGCLEWLATRDRRRLNLVAITADGELDAGYAQLTRNQDGTDAWRAHLSGSGGSIGDYQSDDGLIEALERHAAVHGPWWTTPVTRHGGQNPEDGST